MIIEQTPLFSKRKTREQRGSILILVMFSVFFMAWLANYFLQANSTVQSLQARANFLNFVSQTQLDIRNALNSYPAWQATIWDPNNNANLSCFRNSSCNPTTLPSNRNFVLWPAGVTNYSDHSKSLFDSNPVAGTSNQYYGFQMNGQPCNTFTLEGNPDCPISFVMTWNVTAPCSAQSCVADLVVNLLYRPGARSPIGPINENNFVLSFTQSLTGNNALCMGQPTAAEAAPCPGPFHAYSMYCTPTGWVCGQVYAN